MILPEQQALYDYWRGKCQAGKLPTRQDIDPSDICAHLPMVSLIEVKKTTHKTRFQCRLAGTGFWDLYEEEIQGRYIDELPLVSDRRTYWHRVLSQVANNRRPTAGVTKPGTKLGSHLAQFWIRLPLSTNGRDVDLILGYDHLAKMPNTEAAKKQLVPMRVTA
ncbi:MAG: PAS domain-containing protein [Hellea sp.]|nr:PAS domain-containing protein [Hellea sp.]